jgi:hypothetical protein
MGAIYRDQTVELNLNGQTISGLLEGAWGTSVLLFERCAVHLFNGTLDGRAGTNEHAHCVRFLNCPSVYMHDVMLLGGKGDGVYISHDQPGSTGTGSRNVVIERIHGKGTNQGRNFISIICGETMRIEDWSTEAWTAPGMPGGLDIEPDLPQEYVDDVMIRRGQIFAGTAGALAGIMVYNQIGHAPITRIYSEDCQVWGPFNAGLRLGGSPHQSETVTHIRPLVRNCRVNVMEENGKMTIVDPRFHRRRRRKRHA